MCDAGRFGKEEGGTFCCRCLTARTGLGLGRARPLTSPTERPLAPPRPPARPSRPRNRSFAEASERQTGQRGVDRVRGSQIGVMDVSLKYFEEVFTSQHWMMRIYRVRDKPLRDGAKPKSGRVRAALAAAAA